MDSQTWVFQINPKLYNCREAVRSLKQTTALVQQHRKHIHPGDVVLIFESGKEGGIVAKAKVLTSPASIVQEPAEEQYALDPKKFEGPRVRVRLQIEKVIDPPISRTELQRDDRLRSWKILRGVQGTNFAVPPEQANALSEATHGDFPASRTLVQRLLVARIGWMKYYSGPKTGDERPLGGGKFTKTHIGHEAFNFQVLDGNVYGYFQPQMRASNIRLERIEKGFTNNTLEDVLVLFVAPSPNHGGQRLVGWYKHATVYRFQRTLPAGSRPYLDYFTRTSMNNAVLLPVRKRSFVIPGGKNGIGQANLCYPLEANGTSKNAQWLSEAATFVDEYDDENLIQAPAADAEAETIDVIQSELERAAGFASNPAIRKAVEQLAMNRARQHFERLGYHCKDVSKRKSFDFLCTKGIEELYVEVKGTRTAGEKVLLTKNEVLHANKHPANSVLFIVHSIEVSGGRRPKANGGIEHKIIPWTPAPENLTPLSYLFIVPQVTNILVARSGT